MKSIELQSSLGGRRRGWLKVLALLAIVIALRVGLLLACRVYHVNQCLACIDESVGAAVNRDFSDHKPPPYGIQIHRKWPTKSFSVLPFEHISAIRLMGRDKASCLTINSCFLGSDRVYFRPRIVELRYTDITTSVLSAWDLSELEYCDLTGCDVRDELLQALRVSRNLHTVLLGETGISDDGIAQLAGLPSLDALVLHDTQISQRSVEMMRRVASLELIDVSRTKIMPEDVLLLRTLKNLQILHCEGIPFDDDDLSRFVEFPALEKLNISGRRFSFEGIKKSLADLKLKSLWIVDATMSDEDIDEIRRLFPMVKIEN